jgi:hypothetical protein
MQNFKEKYWYIFALFFGLFSGFLTYNFYLWAIGEVDHIENMSFYENLTSITLGFLFGLVSLLYFYLFSFKKISLLNSFLWLFFSFLSYFFASKFTKYITGGQFVTDGDTHISLFLLLGFLGIFVLIPAFHFLIARITLAQAFVLLIVGVLSAFGTFLAFYSWQTTVLITFGYFIHKENMRFLSTQNTM